MVWSLLRIEDYCVRPGLETSLEVSVI
ncbi:hypothetical protein AGR4B_pAt10110 [Agrobacterium tumefaciens str. CFBP 5621]|nr:hypothetical protein AGR4B_pAt10110 [Agrobacterium tumefaciens str. CFBP 5621]